MSDQALALFKLAHEVLGSEQLAHYWLRNANPLLNGASPAQAVTTAEGRRMVERQLAWFAGIPAAYAQTAAQMPDRLLDLANDPLIQMVLARAGSGPEQLLQLYRRPDGARKAA